MTTTTPSMPTPATAMVFTPEHNDHVSMPLATSLQLKLRPGLACLSVLMCGLLMGAHVYKRVNEAGPELSQGRPFHMVPQGGTASFVTRAATDIHLLSYFVIEKGQQPKQNYALTLAFLSKSGTVYDQRDIQLTVAPDEDSPTLADGATLSQARLVPLVVPADATLLQIKSNDGRVLLSANQQLKNRRTPDAVVERGGRPSTWFDERELANVGVHGWAALPALSALPIVKLPLQAEIEEPSEDALANRVMPLRVEAHRALVFNVNGPGRMTIVLNSDDGAAGRYHLDHIGPQGSGKLDIEHGHAALSLPAGPSSVIIRPLNGIGATVNLRTQKLHTLGRLDEIMEPAGRLGSAWHLADNKPLRFGFEGESGTLGTVRVSAHAASLPTTGTITWRFLDAHENELRRGELPLLNAYDPFTALQEAGAVSDLGAETKMFLTPTSDTASIEVSAQSAVIAVEMLLEAGAEPEPLPPYDDPLGPTVRWHDVPVRSPRWVMLRPLAQQSERRTLYAAVIRTPRMEPIGPLPQGPFVAVTPVGTQKLSRLLEHPKHLTAWQDIQTLIPMEQDTEVTIDGKGKNARRVVLSCEIPDQLGGELALRIDGRKVAKSAISTSNVRLDANTKSGEHKVRVEGAPKGLCTVAAPPADEKPTVRRTLYLLPADKGLTVKVKPHRGAPMRLHYAIYSESGSGNKEAPFAVTIDGGSPGRKIGSSPTFTIARARQNLKFERGNFSLLHPGANRELSAVAVSGVQLGDDLPSGNHKIKLRPLSSGRYWARFWVEGRGRRPDTAESFIITDPTEHGEVDE